MSNGISEGRSSQRKGSKSKATVIRSDFGEGMGVGLNGSAISTVGGYVFKEFRMESFLKKMKS
jgi:hypothetical protein